MGSDESAAAVRRWFQAIDDGDPDAERAVRAPNFVAHVPGMPGPLDGEEWEQFIGIFREGFPDMRLVVEDVVAQGDRVAVRWTFVGTHEGEFFGSPPTGARVRMSAIEINRVVDGKIAEHWVELDQLGMLQQVGAIPSPY